ncbi:hypothetical protein K8I85_14765, partial [bacterium]|nr:hypothetical protein [bacterium]
CFAPDDPPTTVDCNLITPAEWASDYRGFASEGEACTNCPPFFGCCSPFADTNEYGWSISGSRTDPYQNVRPLSAGADTLFLFLLCSRFDGAAAAHIVPAPSDSSLLLLDVHFQDNVLNAGTTTDLQLAIGGCPRDPALIASFTVYRPPSPVAPATWGAVKALYR